MNSVQQDKYHGAHPCLRVTSLPQERVAGNLVLMSHLTHDMSSNAPAGPYRPSSAPDPLCQSVQRSVSHTWLPWPFLTPADASCQYLRRKLRAIQFSNSIPMRASACAGWAANRRHAAAMLVCPAHRTSPMAGLRNAAIMWGIWPQRTCEPAIPAEPPSPVITGFVARAFRKLRCENTP